MNRKLNKNKSLRFHLLYILFVFSLLYVFGLGINLELNIFVQIILVSFVSSLVKFFILNPLILYITLGISLISSLLLNRYLNPFIFSAIERSYHLFKNIIENLQGKEIILSDNILLFWGLIMLIFSTFTALIIFKGKDIYCLLPIYISFFVYYWYAFFNEAYWMIALFLFLFFIFIGLDNSPGINFNHFWIKKTVLYSSFIILISLILPKPNNYIQWSWLDEKIYDLFPIVKDLRSHNPSTEVTEKPILFDFCLTGFQDKPCTLGGPIVLDHTKIMTVYADDSNYLRGSVKHIYRGNSWCSKQVPWENHIVNEDFSNLSKEDRELYYEKFNLKIVNHFHPFTTLFSPYRATKISMPGNYSITEILDNILVIKRGIYSGETYKVEFEKPLPYGILVSQDINRKKEDIDFLDSYLQIPNGKITERTKALVKEIVKDSEDDFEKATAIESYLRNNYEYSLDVDTVPANHEFIDYFLFVEEKGYCTYFATTMALMLRLEGIPSRYIEGYLAQDLVKKGVYEVKQSNAHAWVEAFIEPVGWMTFEATPSFSLESRLEDYDETIVNSDTIEVINDDNNIDLEESIDESIILGDGEFIDGEYEGQNSLSGDYSVGSFMRAIFNILKILIFIILIIILINIFKYEHQKRQVQKFSNKNKVLYLYEDILNLMNLLGYPQVAGETHFEYSNRIAYNFFKFEEKGIIEITKIFVRSKYSNEITSDKDVIELDLYRNSLENNLKIHLGTIIYYFTKYIKI